MPVVSRKKSAVRLFALSNSCMRGTHFHFVSNSIGIVSKLFSVPTENTYLCAMKNSVLTFVFAMMALVGWAESPAGYRNPIIHADVPDMSVCWADGYYYMVSTTMHLMPGCPVMRSADMQQWETVSYVFDRIDDGPRYDLLDNQSVYGRGQWASSIRYYNNRFYVWFTANGAPGKGFVFSAEKAEGPWTLVSRPPHMHDGSLFFDEDGRVYMFYGTGHLTELNPDLSGPKEGGIDQQIFVRDADEQGLLEGSSVVKRNGKYYLLMISMDWSIPGRLRREVCYRADRITGPYTKKVILETPFEEFGGVGQGCIVGNDKDEWKAIIFQDRGGIGRVPCLMPCRWIDDWPMLGDENGRIPNDEHEPYSDLSGINGSDGFESPDLSLYWQWNHNPIPNGWSLSERPGFLRLRTSRLVPNLYVAPNTLTQRMLGPESTGTACVDVSGMKDGDVAGLSAFNSIGGVLSVERKDGKYKLVWSEQDAVFNAKNGVDDVKVQVFEEKPLSEFPLHRIWLRVSGDFRHGRDKASAAYSLDGVHWNPLQGEARMVFDYRRFFMGTKFALFNYATTTTGGYVDFDSFELWHSRN